MKLSFSTRGWLDLPWQEVVDTALDMRFGGIEVYNLHIPISDDNYVTGAEAFRRPAGVIQSRFREQDRVFGTLPSRGDALLHVVHEGLNVFLHLCRLPTPKEKIRRSPKSICAQSASASMNCGVRRSMRLRYSKTKRFSPVTELRRRPCSVPSF